MRPRAGHAVVVSCLVVGGSLAWAHRLDTRPHVTVDVRLPRDAVVDAFRLPRGVSTARVWPSGEMSLEVLVDATPLPLRAGDLGPVPIRQPSERDPVDLEAKAWIDLGGDRAQVGFD